MLAKKHSWHIKLISGCSNRAMAPSSVLTPYMWNRLIKQPSIMKWWDMILYLVLILMSIKSYTIKLVKALRLMFLMKRLKVCNLWQDFLSGVSEVYLESFQTRKMDCFAIRFIWDDWQDSKYASECLFFITFTCFHNFEYYHCVKYLNFTYFPGLKIFSKGAVSV